MVKFFLGFLRPNILEISSQQNFQKFTVVGNLLWPSSKEGHIFPKGTWIETGIWILWSTDSVWNYKNFWHFLLWVSFMESEKQRASYFKQILEYNCQDIIQSSIWNTYQICGIPNKCSTPEIHSSWKVHRIPRSLGKI